jgi:hypothetical protein
MSALALVSGTLFKSAEQRTSKSGRAFVTATIKAKAGESVEWWRFTAFSESAQAELLWLSDGDARSVQGPFKAELYTKDGEPRISLGVTVERILPLRQESKPRQPKAVTPPDNRPRDERLRGSWQSPHDGPNDSLDDLPF